ncbi:hypothetical protein TWF679_000131 [Orbilia oligospora]|uniref:PA14 domain-containing protein n=1 Tax=Orbilia oligospora TaxID=2813651 RepID=A0A8H8VN56_ORBOL|nr:hypothetical protein TWF679_000131 [Orbilia oligospora]
MPSGSARIFVGAVLCAWLANVAATPNPNACHANNCLRALRGLASKSYDRVSADCSNYVWTTMTETTPATVTEISTVTEVEATEAIETITETSYEIVTSTVAAITILVTETNPDPHAAVTARDFDTRNCASTENPIPTYASACTSGAGYASACSCFGVPASVSTVVPPAATIVEEITTTITTVSSAVVHSTTTSTSTSTVGGVVEYTAFSLAVTETGPNFPRQWNPPGETKLYIYSGGIYAWEVTGTPGTSMILQDDGRMYVPYNGKRAYYYCRQAYDDWTEKVLPGAMSFAPRPPEFFFTLGQDVTCSWGEDKIIKCSCTVDGVVYDKMTYREDKGIYAEVTLRSGPIPAGLAEAEITAKVYAAKQCQANSEPDGTGCVGWINPNDTPVWTQWKKKRSLRFR